jgi:flagellar motor switch protein FliN/FliY
MSINALPPRAYDALDAVSTFLSTLLGGEIALTAEPTDVTEAATAGRIVLVGNSEAGEPLFVVGLDEGWAPVLSQAMLGEAIPAAEAGDLLQELGGQAYGSFRTAAGAEGPTPPAVLFAVAEAAPSLPEPLGAVAFTWAREAEPLTGTILLPAALLQAATPPAAPPPAAQPEPAAPPPQPQAAAGPPVEIARAAFDDFGGENFGGGDGSDNLHVLSDVELEVTVELGRRRIPLADVLRLTTGSVIELEKLVGQPLEVYANGRLIAEGEAVVIDEQFGVRVTSLASRRKQQRAFL